MQCAVPHAIKAFRNNVFTGCITFFSYSGPIKACTFKSFSKNNNRPLCHSFTESIVSFHRAWHCVGQRGHVSWDPMCTQRPLMEAGDGWWPRRSSWWRFSPTAPSRASAFSFRTSWRNLGRPTVGSCGSFPSACSS